jgi:D-sedoheptulose 7-phosphate isomerase
MSEASVGIPGPHFVGNAPDSFGLLTLRPVNALDRVRTALGESIRVKQALLESCAPVIAQAAEEVLATFRRDRKVLLFGNGGSASDAAHIAAEWVGRYAGERVALPAMALAANLSELTAVANDYGYDRVFVRGVEAHGEAGDLAIALSTSGNSPNVLAGVEAARAKGLFTIGLTGKGGGQLAGAVDVAIRVPSDETPRIQEAHIAIGHALCEVVDDAYRGEGSE